MKLVSTIASAIIATISVACSSATDDTAAPTVATEGTDELAPRSVLQYSSCTARTTYTTSGFAYWYYGGGYGPAPTAAECDAWCVGTCGRPKGGRFQAPAYNPGRPLTATCYCRL